MKSGLRHAGVLATGVLGLALSPIAQAVIEEIVVTAQKRESDLQDTPIAITAFDGDAIERNQIEDFRDIALRTPGLVFAQTDAMSIIALRGVGLDITSLGGETAVAAYQDGVYLGQSFTLSMPAFDLQRIEVLRGPQGTLYGRNATGGAVNLVTRGPSFEPDANLALSYGDYDHFKVEAGGSTGLSKSVAVRGSIVYDNRGDGYRDLVSLGRKTRGDESVAGNFSMLITPADDLDITLRGNFADQVTGFGTFENLQFAPAGGTLLTPNNVGGFFTFPDPALGGLSLADVFGLDFPVAMAGNAPTDPNDLEAAGELRNKQESDVWGVSATVEWDLGEMTLKSITAYRDINWKRLSDEDGTDLQLLTLDGIQGAETFTQEINLSGTSAEGRLDWLVGGYYFNEDASAEFLYDLSAFQVFYEALIGVFGTGAPLPSGSLQLLSAGNPLGEGIGRRQGQVAPWPFLHFTMEQDSKSYAAFGEGRYSLTEDFSLTLGARWTRDEKDTTRSLTSNFVSILAPAGLCIDSPDGDEWSEVTGNVIAEYQIEENSLVFGKVSRGYKAGGFNPGECLGGFNPEIIWAYEAGLKTRLFDDQMQLNSALFHYDYKDIQINRFINNASSVTNAAEAKIFGVEAEFIIAPRAAEGFRLSGSVGFLDTKYQDATFADPINGGPVIDVSGNDLLRAPNWKFSLAAQYGFQLGDAGEILLLGDVHYSDSYHFDVFEASLPNQSEMEQQSYAIANARVSWLPAAGDYEVMFFVENITDELYAETRVAVGTTGAVIGMFSRPRTWGVRVSAKFGAGR